jgi:hypothetical protein
MSPKKSSYFVVCNCRDTDYSQVKQVLGVLRSEFKDQNISFSIRNDPLYCGILIYNPLRETYTTLVEQCTEFDTVFGNCFQIAVKIRRFINRHPLKGKSTVFLKQTTKKNKKKSLLFTIMCSESHYDHLNKKFANVILKYKDNEEAEDNQVNLIIGKHKESVVLHNYDAAKKKHNKYIASLAVE